MKFMKFYFFFIIHVLYLSGLETSTSYLIINRLRIFSLVFRKLSVSNQNIIVSKVTWTEVLPLSGHAYIQIQCRFLGCIIYLLPSRNVYIIKTYF